MSWKATWGFWAELTLKAHTTSKNAVTKNMMSKNTLVWQLARLWGTEKIEYEVRKKHHHCTSIGHLTLGSSEEADCPSSSSEAKKAIFCKPSHKVGIISLLVTPSSDAAAGPQSQLRNSTETVLSGKSRSPSPPPPPFTNVTAPPTFPPPQPEE